ncbi:MAG: hypothetical protein M1819_002665 [Sarea resinae]|nr:MAG: hypothetical protein M1819_002665 [Sarea resinae]
MNNHAVNGENSDGGSGSRGSTDDANALRSDVKGKMSPNSNQAGPNGLVDARNGMTSQGDDMEGVRSNAVGSFHELPPEIEHITMGYQPLSKLITRLTQDCFNNLTEVLEAMSDVSLPPNSSSAHGTDQPGVNGHGGASELNVQKKMRLMNFAQTRREQFIKVLVLSQWSRQAADVSKVIDLKVWLDRQRGLYDEAGGWLGEMKRNLEPAKMPNPDLKTALEVLSTGRASWLPDLGYIPPKPLTPERMLKTLRNINTLLSIRLNLHETLPTHFKNFTISSGRATFSVPFEFEVDLSIGDEDPTSQLYFIDFRFLFSPSSEIPAGRLRNDLEAKANDVLRREGLPGCYNLLHQLVLTHKINVLRRQALEMSRGRWTESIRLEMVRRTLVIEYWLNRPAGKSWIEIGIKSGRRREGKVLKDGSSTPTIGIRWVRNGKEVSGHPIEIDAGLLSMESLLKRVVASHASQILTSIYGKLSAVPLYARGALSISLSTSETEPVECALNVQLTASETITISVEPMTGRFALYPASPLSLRAEHEINSIRDPADEAHTRIANLRCLVAQEEIDSRAKCVGWKPLKSFSPKFEDIKRLLPRDTLRISMFRREGWWRVFILAVCIGMSGETWWIIETVETAMELKIKSAIPLSTQGNVTGVSNLSYVFFSRLEYAAASMISHFVHTRDLSRRGVQHKMRADPSHATVRIPDLLISVSSLMNSTPGQRPDRTEDLVRVTYQGVSSRSGEMSLVTEASLHLGKERAEMIKDRVDDGVEFDPERQVFSFKVKMTVGESVIPELITRLRRIERLVDFLGIMKRSNFKCDTVSLDRVVFAYSAEPDLKADIYFGAEAGMTIRLEQGNPHLRIKDFLTHILNGPSHGLSLMTNLLLQTLPVVRTLDTIEAAGLVPPSSEPATTGPRKGTLILPRSADCYNIRYANPRCVLQIKLRRRRDKSEWFVDDVSNAHDRKSRSPDFTAALATLFTDSGPGWRGLRTGITAEPDGVSDILTRLDQCIGRFAETGTASGTAQRPAGGDGSAKGADGHEIVVLD